MARNAAVIGHPIKHSKSPLIHSYWMKQHNIDANYTAIDIAPEDFSQNVLALIARSDISGFNVTLPHKESVISICNNLEENARKIGAVNTVYKDEGDAICGANTDAYGFWQNIVSSHPDFSVQGEKVCVLGAGGAARAVIYALKEQGASEILIFNRSLDKAEALAKDFDAKAYRWDQREHYLADCKLLVNTTSLGMDGKPALEIDLSSLNPEALVNDIVYVPLQTELLQKAADRGNKTVQGIGMLLYQAQKAFEYWYGVLPEIDETIIQRVLK